MAGGFKYEMHLHTYPVSKCAKADVRGSLEFYKSLGYEGVFITNHFLDGNINISPLKSYEERLAFYFSDYDEGVRIGEEIGLRVFLGVELSYRGTDFLVYGLKKEWYFEHPEIMQMKKSEELKFIMESGGYVVQAHPYREATYIDHIRLFPRLVNAVEVVNASRPDFENEMAKHYAASYGLSTLAGSDNHVGALAKRLAGIITDTAIESEQDFISRMKSGNISLFCE